MLTRLAGPVLAAALAAAAAGCGGSSSTEAQPSASPSAAAIAAPSPTHLQIDPDAALTQTYSTTVFKPAMRLKLPADWQPAERDEGGFQMYAGADEEYELTFDHAYTKQETVAAAIARLRATEGLRPGPEFAVDMGGRRGEGFASTGDNPLRFSDSGFHVPTSEIEVMAVPLTDGTTLTVFVYSRPGLPLAPTSRLARRIMASVTWR